MRRVAAMVFGSGGGLSAVGFFLPWVSFSCSGEERVFTGATLAQEGSPQLWLILGLGVLLVGLAVLFLMGPQSAPAPTNDLDVESIKRELSFERRYALGHFVVLLASLCGLGLLIVEYVQQSRNTESFGYTLSALGIQIEGGAWASSLGFCAGCIGSILGLRSAPKDSSDQGP